MKKALTPREWQPYPNWLSNNDGDDYYNWVWPFDETGHGYVSSSIEKPTHDPRLSSFLKC